MLTIIQQTCSMKKEHEIHEVVTAKNKFIRAEVVCATVSSVCFISLHSSMSTVIRHIVMRKMFL